MKRVVVFLLGAGVIFILTAAALSQERPGNGSKKGTLVVLIDGFENDQGDARAGLCNSPEEYKSERETFRQAALPIKSGRVEWVLKDLPWGEYAVKVHHDKNANGILDKNASGYRQGGLRFFQQCTGILRAARL